MSRHGHAFRLGPRFPVPRPTDQVENAGLGDGVDANEKSLFGSRALLARADTTSSSVTTHTSCTSENANLCEKPASSMSMTVPIALGVAIPVVAIIVTFIWLHRRNTIRQRKEDLDDPHKSLDFGLDEGKKRKSVFFGGKEKDAKHRAQLSMDMNLSTPYLLPPQMQGSRDSLHSLARSLKKDDPYGPVDDVSSIKSGRPGMGRKNTDGLSVYTTSSANGSRYGPYNNGPLRQDSLPQSVGSVPNSPYTSSPPRRNPFDSPVQSEDALPAMPSPPPSSVAPRRPNPPMESDLSTGHQSMAAQIESVPESLEPNPIIVDQPAVQEPTPALLPNHSSLRSSVHHDGFDFGLDAPAPLKLTTTSDDDMYSKRQSPKNLGLLDSPTVKIGPRLHTESVDKSEKPLDNSYQAYDPVNVPDVQYDDEEYPGRGRHPSRRSNMIGQEASLGVPQQDNKRLSVGLRPLPPSEVLETEDPERRADRIRSFYKEYFEESKRESVVPPLPGMPFQGDRETKETDYYEDYDQNYLGETAFFDPESNSFVMPYAAPVTRRAMTPPPRGRVPGGPFRGPRPHAGSIGGMSLQGGRGPMGHPRAGSAMSGRFRGPMPGSMPGSRSGSRAPANRKPMPPPAALSTLPTPSKLKDDFFLNGIDFAPPETFADCAAGRSQSPIGERKPYQLRVPVASPLSSSYDDMAALPSPHLLRKSGTFTALDFAPPKRFKDPDQMSDAGSIRSNRTGISVANSHAIKSGAGRVSRLPGDTVFTQANLNSQLKPQWGMRP